MATVKKLYLPCLQREGLWREPTGVTTVTVSSPDTGERCRRDRVRLCWRLTCLQALVRPLKPDSDGHVANGCLLTEMRKEMRNYCKLGSCHWQPYYHTGAERQYTHMHPQRLQEQHTSGATLGMLVCVRGWYSLVSNGRCIPGLCVFRPWAPQQPPDCSSTNRQQSPGLLHRGRA